MGFAGAAAAQQPRPAAPSSFGQVQPAPAPHRVQAPPGSGRAGMPMGGVKEFEDSSNGKTFVLERRGPVFLLQFRGDPEVYVLHPSNGPGGDIMLRSDNGQLVLRVTERGNVISYLSSAAGVPADAMLASATASRQIALSPMTASLTAVQKDAVKQLTRFAGHDVTVFGTGAFGDNEAWAADVLTIVVKGVEGAGSAGKTVKAVRLQRSTLPSVAFRDGELLISGNPADGYRGRVSSDKISEVLKSGGM